MFVFFRCFVILFVCCLCFAFVFLCLRVVVISGTGCLMRVYVCVVFFFNGRREVLYFLMCRISKSHKSVGRLARVTRVK